MTILTLNGIVKAFTDKELLKGVDLGVDENDRIGVIGINGTGKTTFLRIMAGLEEPDGGTRTVANHVVVRYLAQNPEFEKGQTIYDYVVTANRCEENDWSIEGEAKTILNRLGFEQYDMKLEHLSGGQRKKVALAGALLSRCELLILDEPTNHLDHAMTEWLEEYLKRRSGAFLMVTHDRYFLDRVCNRIVEIDHGKLYEYTGNYETYLNLKAQRMEMVQASERKRQSIMRKELEWLKRGAQARSTKQKARIDRYDEMASIEKEAVDGVTSIQTVSSRIGKKTIEVDGISKSYGEKKLFHEFTYYFTKEDRIGIVGPNGCGKTTLLRILTGDLKPDAGEVRIGDTIKIGYYAQENGALPETERVIDYIKETSDSIMTSEGRLSASQMLEQFLFDSTLQYAMIGRLSGGEKRRLYLLKVLMEAPNVLILDEPTNDLDIPTLQVLEDYLEAFPGIVIAVSHDRYFLDRSVQRIFAIESDGIQMYEGNYSDYLSKSSAENTSMIKDTKQGKEATQVKTEKPRSQKLKMTYKEEKEYETIEDDIEKLEKLISELEQEIFLNATDFVKLNELSAKKEQTEKELEEKMDRYVYLSELAEKIADESAE